MYNSGEGRGSLCLGPPPPISQEQKQQRNKLRDAAAATSQAPITSHSHTGCGGQRAGRPLAYLPPNPVEAEAPGPAALRSLGQAALEARGSVS